MASLGSWPFAHDYEFWLCFFYAVIGMVVCKLVRSGGGSGVAVAKGSTAILWLGFVLAISGLESWVKFRSPLIRVAGAGYDVGARVFRALNVVEVVFLAMYGLLAWPCDNATERQVCWALTAILGVQVVFLTPALHTLGKFKILDAVGEQETLPRGAKTYITAIQSEIADSRRPLRILHTLYVTLEVLKVALLPTLAFGAFATHMEGS